MVLENRLMKKSEIIRIDNNDGIVSRNRARRHGIFIPPNSSLHQQFVSIAQQIANTYSFSSQLED